MKNLSQFPEPSQPRPNAPLARPPHRRRLNLARAGVAVAVIALLGLGAFAANAYQAWSQPMPLKHRVVRVVSALQIPQGHIERVFAPGDSLTHGDFSHITLQTDTVYAGAPLEVSAATDVPLILHLPPQAVIVGPAGPTISFSQSQSGNEAMMTWRASVPTTAVPSVVGTPSGITYASWYVEFTAPGTYRIPVLIGGATSTATVDVLPVPAGGKVTAHMTPPISLHPNMVVQDTGSTPAPVVMGGLARTLSPGQSVSVEPGSAYVVTFSPTTSASLAESVYQTTGTVHVTGTITRHRVVAYRLPHPAFLSTLPSWFWAALILAFLTLASSLVASATGGRGGRGRGGRGGRGGKGPGTAGDGTSGPDANAS